MEDQLDFYVAYGSASNYESGWLICFKGEEAYLTYNEGCKELVFDTEAEAMAALLKFVNAGYSTAESAETLTTAKIKEILGVTDDESVVYDLDYLELVARYVKGECLSDEDEELLECYEDEFCDNLVHERRLSLMARIGANSVLGINES